jgi:raffinose/stachyose/melibiose transport system substrate-binding protein
MSPPLRSSDRRQKIRNAVGLALLAVVFTWSIVVVARRTFGPTSETSLVGDKKVIRFVHWQLEAGYMQAMDEARRQYMRLHPDVVVEQIDVHERAYYQWVQTQLIGRTAPDLIENRFQGGLIVRYFVPLTTIVEEPNPYNSRAWDERLKALVVEDRARAIRADPARSDAEKERLIREVQREADEPREGDLEGVPWRETFIDGMMGAYQIELRDYYSVPTSVFTMRIYANKDIVKKATGEAKAPKTLGEFFRLCRAIEDYARKNDLKLVPIAGSNYTESMFRNKYNTMGTWGTLEAQDDDHDAGVTYGERVLAVQTDRIPLETDPYLEATHKILYDICRFYNRGFMAANRDESVFLFAQGNAAMIATGTWDAGSLWQQAQGDFEIMVFDFPVPGPGEPYSNVVAERVTEAGTMVQGLYSLSRFSRHPDVALDFMKFLTSRRINEDINRKFRWFPGVRGARTEDILKPFEPKLEGVYEIFIFKYLPDIELRYEQQYKDFISDVPPADRPYAEYLDEHYKQFMARYARDFRKYSLEDLRKMLETQYNSGVQTEVSLCQLRARALREGLTPDVKASLMAVTLGQVRRLQERAVDWTRYEKAKAAYEARLAAGGDR